MGDKEKELEEMTRQRAELQELFKEFGPEEIEEVRGWITSTIKRKNARTYYYSGQSNAALVQARLTALDESIRQMQLSDFAAMEKEVTVAKDSCAKAKSNAIAHDTKIGGLDAELKKVSDDMQSNSQKLAKLAGSDCCSSAMGAAIAKAMQSSLMLGQAQAATALQQKSAQDDSKAIFNHLAEEVGSIMKRKTLRTQIRATEKALDATSSCEDSAIVLNWLGKVASRFQPLPMPQAPQLKSLVDTSRPIEYEYVPEPPMEESAIEDK